MDGDSNKKQVENGRGAHSKKQPVLNVADPDSKFKRAERDPDLAVKSVSPIVDFVIGVAFVLLCIRLSWELYQNSLLLQFLVLVLLVAVGAQVVSNVSLWVGLTISNMRVGESIPEECHKPLAGPLMQRKFKDQAWQLFIHSTMAALEIYIVSDTTWWWDPPSAFSPCPRFFLEGTAHHIWIVEFFYILQLAIWVWTGFSCKWLESRRKDYVEMMVHHLATVSLVLGSLIYHEHAFGILVLLAHDLSDVPLDLLKMSNYLKLEDRHGYYIVEFFFSITTFVTWPYLRLYYFPYRLAYLGSFYGYGSLCAQGDSLYEQCATTGSRCHGTVLLAILTVLHVYWWLLLLRVLRKLISGKTGAQAGREEYEGHSE